MLAVDLNRIKVSDSLAVDRHDEQVRFLGGSKGNINAVKAAWLLLVITLRLENGEHVEVILAEVTDLIALSSQFF